MSHAITYIELPAFQSWPVICHTSNYDGFACFLVSLYELLDSDVVDADSLNCVSESSRVVDFEHVVLFLPVPILTPFTQWVTCPVHRFHVVHLFDKLVRHAASLEDGIGKSSLLGEFYSFMIYDIFNRQFLENFCFDISQLFRRLSFVLLLTFFLLFDSQLLCTFLSCNHLALAHLIRIDLIGAGIHWLRDYRCNLLLFRILITWSGGSFR